MLFIKYNIRINFLILLDLSNSYRCFSFDIYITKKTLLKNHISSPFLQIEITLYKIINEMIFHAYKKSPHINVFEREFT